MRKYLVKSWVVLCWLPALAAWHIIKGWKVEVGCSLILKYQILLILIFTTKLNLNSAHEDENFKLSLHTTERSPTFTSTAFSCTQHFVPNAQSRRGLLQVCLCVIYLKALQIHFSEFGNRLCLSISQFLCCVLVCVFPRSC